MIVPPYAKNAIKTQPEMRIETIAPRKDRRSRGELFDLSLKLTYLYCC